MSSIFYNTIKITIGVIVAIFISEWLRLDFALSAGVITMLTMIDIKRKSLHVSIKRIISAVIALLISAALFTLFHFTLWSFGLFLIIYIPILLKFKATEGLVVNTVLITHIYSFSEITVSNLLNEVYLLLIGISIALIFNLHMPNREEEIIKLQRKLEAQLRSFLRSMSMNLKNHCEINGQYATLVDLKKTIDEGISKSLAFLNSYYLKENNYYLLYFEMRKHQYGRLRYMQEHCNTVFITQHEANILSEFTQQLSEVIHEFNTGEEALEDLEELRIYFKGSELPKSREEFENRALLYQYLNDLEEFILIKNRFVDNLKKEVAKT